MKTEAIINLFSSALFVMAFYRQVMIVVYMKKNDPYKATKILFPVFNACLVFAMWLPYFDRMIASALFFLMAAGITVWTYFKPPKQLK